MKTTERHRPGEIIREEVAYRRGWHQCLCLVIEALDRGRTLDDLREYEPVVKHWREEKRKFPDNPPTIS